MISEDHAHNKHGRPYDQALARHKETLPALSTAQGLSMTVSSIVSRRSQAQSKAFQSSKQAVPRRIGAFLLSSSLGSGGFGVVKKAIHLPTGHTVAAKLIDKTTLKEDDYLQRAVEREITIMGSLHHPNIIELFDVVRADTFYCFFTELGGQDLLHLLEDEGSLPEHRARMLSRQLVSAIMYLHSKDIVHRDIKAENLLINEDNTLKLIDFGLSNMIEEGGVLSTWCGSLSYSAPELLGKKPYDKAVDVWGIGVMVYVMLTCKLPFPARNLTQLHALILDKSYTFPEGLSQPVRQLLDSTFEFKPKKRISLDSIATHSWITADGNYPAVTCEADTCQPNLQTKSVHEGQGLDKEPWKEAAKQRMEYLLATYGSNRAISSEKSRDLTLRFLSQERKVRKHAAPLRSHLRGLLGSQSRGSSMSAPSSQGSDRKTGLNRSNSSSITRKKTSDSAGPTLTTNRGGSKSLQSSPRLERRSTSRQEMLSPLEQRKRSSSRSPLRVPSDKAAQNKCRSTSFTDRRTLDATLQSSGRRTASPRLDAHGRSATVAELLPPIPTISESDQDTYMELSFLAEPGRGFQGVLSDAVDQLKRAFPLTGRTRSRSRSRQSTTPSPTGLEEWSMHCNADSPFWLFHRAIHRALWTARYPAPLLECLDSLGWDGLLIDGAADPRDIISSLVEALPDFIDAKDVLRFSPTGHSPVSLPEIGKQASSPAMRPSPTRARNGAVRKKRIASDTCNNDALSQDKEEPEGFRRRAKTLG